MALALGLLALVLGLTLWRLFRLQRRLVQHQRNYEALLKYRIDYHRREASREQVIASLERAVGVAISGGPSE